MSADSTPSGDRPPPEFRRDPVLPRWTILAPSRAARPHDTSGEAARSCPFCAGHEGDTPPAILERRLSDAPADEPWSVRCVPNRFPVVASNCLYSAAGFAAGGQTPAAGLHHVIVESARHETRFGVLRASQVRLILDVFRALMLDAARDPRWATAMVFKNVGAAAGASLAHVHSQFLALPFVPPAWQQEQMALAADAASHATPYFSRLVEAEAKSGARVVAETPLLLAFCPFASRVPLETWIVPRTPAPYFHLASDELLDELAPLWLSMLARLEAISPNAAYNVVWCDAPLREAAPGSCWRIEVLPRFAQPAGLEWSTDCFANSVAPEAAARMLRG